MVEVRGRDVGVGIRKHGGLLGADLYPAGGGEHLKPVLGAGGDARCAIAPSSFSRSPEGAKRLKGQKDEPMRAILTHPSQSRPGGEPHPGLKADAARGSRP